MLDLNEIPVAEGTRRTYLNALANLDKWLKGRPVNDENLAGYLSYLYDKGKSPSYPRTTTKKGETSLAPASLRAKMELKEKRTITNEVQVL